jgi:hypothetical protein
MPDPDPAADAKFAAKLRNRLTELRLRLDLGELESPAAFREALEAGGAFRLTDPRVLEACRNAGFARWLSWTPEA